MVLILFLFLLFKEYSYTMNLRITDANMINGRLHFNLYITDLSQVDVDPNGVIETPIGPFPLVPVRIANLLRQTFMTRISSWCVDVVEIIANTTYLLDELMALRLGLIPLVIEGGLLDDEIKATELSLSVQGSQIGGSGITRVYTDAVASSNPNIKMLPGILLINLSSDQELRFVARIKKGVGREHSKFDVVSISAFEEVEDHFHFQVGINTLISPADLMTVALQEVQAILPIANISYE